MEYVPPPNAWLSTPRWWDYFEDVLPRLQELALMDVDTRLTESIEEAAYFGSRAAYVLILARTILPASRTFYARHQSKNA
jgi:hypothetical protein